MTRLPISLTSSLTSPRTKFHLIARTSRNPRRHKAHEISYRDFHQLPYFFGLVTCCGSIADTIRGMQAVRREGPRSGRTWVPTYPGCTDHLWSKNSEKTARGFDDFFARRHIDHLRHRQCEGLLDHPFRRRRLLCPVRIERSGWQADRLRYRPRQ